MTHNGLQSFLADFPLRRFDKGRVVLYQGEVPRYTYVVKRGIIKAYSITQLGEEKIATFYASNEIFPQIILGDQNLTSLYYYEGLTDCELYVVPRERLIEHIRNNPIALQRLFEIGMTNYLGSLMRITALQQPKAQDKLVHALHHLVQRYGHESDKPGLYHIDIQLTHQTIASFVGLTRETVAGEINRLKRRKIINYKNQNYIVDKSKLLNLINEDSFGNFTY